MPWLIRCRGCGKPTEAFHKNRLYCGVSCGRAYLRRVGPDRERACKTCSVLFEVRRAFDGNRRYCSRQCSRIGHKKQAERFYETHPKVRQTYTARALGKRPSLWRDKHRAERAKSLELLGGRCVVRGCHAANPLWLHIDYAPGTRGKPFRHSRHHRFIREHREDFRILCANHHYELTLSGRIEGTDITQ